MNWDSYRASFEAEASRILGHKVEVTGFEKATILPSPSLTFTDVKVFGDDGAEIMTVGHFDVEIELMPLLQGQIRVVSMTLEKPVVHIDVDTAGGIAWMRRAKAPEPFDPEKVVLDSVSIRDGTLVYQDARTGVAQRFDGIRADINARALNGPWHVSGFYLDQGNQVEFRASTGRVLDDGRLRVKVDFSPARWPVTVGADGVLGIDPADPARRIAYSGTYNVNEIVGGESGPGSGLAQRGGFLAGQRPAGNHQGGPVERPARTLVQPRRRAHGRFRQGAVLLGDGGGAADRPRPDAWQGTDGAG